MVSIASWRCCLYGLICCGQRFKFLYFSVPLRWHLRLLLNIAARHRPIFASEAGSFTCASRLEADFQPSDTIGGNRPRADLPVFDRSVIRAYASLRNLPDDIRKYTGPFRSFAHPAAAVSNVSAPCRLANNHVERVPRLANHHIILVSLKKSR
jgi:hypothetical protein